MMVNVKADYIAKDFLIGNTKVKIATNYCVYKTYEDVQKIFDRVMKKVKPGLVDHLIKQQDNR